MGQSGPVAPRFKTSLIAIALVADLVLAVGIGLVAAPVFTTEAGLSAYDALPSGMRALLGDDPDTGTGSTSLQSRGPIGGWLASLHREALSGDVDAQLARPLDVVADPAPATWSAADTATVRWAVFGDALTYRTTVTSGPEPPTDARWSEPTPGDSRTVKLATGDNWVHVQAMRGASGGPVATIGPLQVDRTPPPAPAFDQGMRMSVSDYRFTFNWSPVSDASGIQGYNLERSGNGVTYEPAATLDPSATTWTERNKPNGDYWFRVRAINGAGLTSEGGNPIIITVDARSNLLPPPAGAWNYGVHATYDSLIHVWDISDTSPYLNLADIHGPSRGGLTPQQYERYLGPGWGLTTDNETLRQIVRDVVGTETNSMEIAMDLYAWLFDATDYDFAKFAATESNFLKANEVLDAGGGICGDLTSLYLTMLRIAKVPARPVHGYLINEDAGSGQGIGGFHMWAEVYVGGQARDGTGDGWMPVDVSGVTGSFEPRHLDIYFGLANPSYLQLGIQEDLGDPNDDKAPGSKWNVWANLRWEYVDDGSPPQPEFNADATITEDTTRSAGGRLYFDPSTHQRKFCETDAGGDLVEANCGKGFTTYYEGLKLRSVRNMDYGADLAWSAGDITTLWLNLKIPETPAPNQAVIYTVYSHDRQCNAIEVPPEPLDNGFRTWELDGARPPCSS